MKITSGKFVGHSVEYALIIDPLYADRLLHKGDLFGSLSTIKSELKRLINIFDEKPFIMKCNGNNCNRIATRASITSKGSFICFWCDECNPKQFGESPTIIKTYQDVLNFLKPYRASSYEYRKMIRRLAMGKGLKRRLTDKNLLEFFSNDEVQTLIVTENNSKPIELSL